MFFGGALETAINYYIDSHFSFFGRNFWII